MTAVTREDREVAIACEYGSDWRSWLSDKRIVQIESYIEGNGTGFSRDHAAERIAAYREASTQALREAAEGTLTRLEAALEAHTFDGRSGAFKQSVRDHARALRSALSPSPAQGGAAVPAVTAPVEGESAFGVAGSQLHVAFWDAINAYAATCGGDPGKHVYGNTRRQRAVVAVEQAVRDLVLVRKATVRP